MRVEPASSSSGCVLRGTSRARGASASLPGAAYATWPSRPAPSACAAARSPREPTASPSAAAATWSPAGRCAWRAAASAEPRTSRGLDRRGVLQAELLDRGVAQLELLHLAGDGHRELGDHRH